MKIKDLFLNINNPVYGDFSDLSKFDFLMAFILFTTKMKSFMSEVHTQEK